MQMKLSGLTVDQHGRNFTIYNKENVQLGQLLFPEDGESLLDAAALHAICKIIAKRYKVNKETG